MPVLREEVPPEVRHEKTHVHPHRFDTALAEKTSAETNRATRERLAVRNAYNISNCVMLFLLQVRSRTSARCAGRPSVRAPISSHTAGNTRGSNLSAVTSAGKVSREKWTCGDTRRRSTDSNEHGYIWTDGRVLFNYFVKCFVLFPTG